VTIEPSIRTLSEKISNLRGCLQALALTARQDAPANLPPAESLANSTTETLGSIHEACAIVHSALADDPSAVPEKLVRAQDRFSRAFFVFFSDRNSFRTRDVSGPASLTALLATLVSYVIRVTYISSYFAMRSIPQSTSPGNN